MANKDRPCGAQCRGQPLRATQYVTGGIVYPGDFVTMNNAGVVVAATAAQACIGVALSYAASGANVMVADHPDQVFEVQSDDGTVDAQTDIGLNYQITATTGDTLYKCSRHELDGNTGVTDSNIPLRLIGVAAVVGDALGTNVKCAVRINFHQLAANTVGL